MTVRKSFVFLAIITCFISTKAARHEDRIVGGKLAAPNQFPFMAFISIRNGNEITICSGTLVDAKWILTAAHCVKDRSKNSINAFVGSVYPAKGEHVSVDEIVIHEKYSSSNSYDVALLKLTQASTSGKPVELGKGSATSDTATIIGWGYTEANAKRAERLHYVEVEITSCSTLEKLIPSSANPNTICTTTSNRKGACNGDSGGPLVQNNKQIGIVSKGLPCAKGLPDVFTSVATFYEWIEKKIDAK